LSETDVRITLPLIILVVLVVAGFFSINRPQLITINAAVARNFPGAGFSHSAFEALLRTYVDTNGHVDYERWHANSMDIAELDSYLAAVVAFSPETTPERFASRNDELAYWLYAYNAYVIRSVLMNWPLDSVTDVKAPIEAVKGMGFFYRLRYQFGGRAYSLLTVENQKIRKQYQDPRIHFVLNCASESCPVIRPELPSGEELEALLDDAASEFVSNPANVFIDHDSETVFLSAIFEWYEDDYLNWLRANGRPATNGVIDYVFTVADRSLQRELESASSYDVEFRDFDWTINAVEIATNTPLE
jgi:hypothetical protein